MNRPDIKYLPAGFAECLLSFTDVCQAEAERIAATASSMTTKGSGFHVEMANEPKFDDAKHGVSRPVAYVVANDEETLAEEAENLISTRAAFG